MNASKWRVPALILISLIVWIANAGCSSGPATAPAIAPIVPLETKQIGEFTLSLYSTPNPPVRGRDLLEVALTDASGQPVTDAKVAFDLDMTNMSHGKNVVPAEPTSQGHYSGQVFFMMPGPWRSIVVIERPGQSPVQARFDFRVNLK